MSLRRSLSVVLLAFAAACSDSPTGPAAAAPDSLKVLPRALSSGELAAIASSNRFAFDLFESINTRFADTNLFISPLSASFALGMTMNGANGETFEGMRQGLRIEETDLASINAAYRDLITLLLDLDSSVDMRIGNAIWYRDGFPFQQSFFDTVAHYFDARVAGLDFGSPATVDRINAWVDTATAGKIPRVIDHIGPDLVMLLMNAIYFKGSWRAQFDPVNTRDAPFTVEGGGTHISRMMHLKNVVAISTVGDAVAVDLPYGRAAFTMTAILPPSGTDVDDFIADLDETKWQAIVDGLHHGEADVYLPKFQMKWEDTLNSDLIAMGMEKAFCEGCADFSRMSPEAGLYISFVKQNTFVNVNEEGTEAAAVTTVGVETTSAGPPPVVRFDRPFVFVIRERLSGTILFMGKVAVPTVDD
jgi:serpin B